MLRILAIVAMLSLALWMITDSAWVAAGFFGLGLGVLLVASAGMYVRRRRVIHILRQEYGYAAHYYDAEAIDDLIAGFEDLSDYDIATAFMAQHVEALALMGNAIDIPSVREIAQNASRLAKDGMVTVGYQTMMHAVQKYHRVVNPVLEAGNGA